MATNTTKKVEIENVNHPGHVSSVDANKYEAMKRAFLKLLPKTSPGLTAAEIREGVIAHLPEDLFRFAFIMIIMNAKWNKSSPTRR